MIKKEEWLSFRRKIKDAYGWHKQVSDSLEWMPCGYQDGKGEEYSDALYKAKIQSFECLDTASKVAAIRLFTSEDKLSKKAERKGGKNWSPQQQRLFYKAHNYKYDFVSTWVLNKIKDIITSVDFSKDEASNLAKGLLNGYGAGDWVRHEVEEFIYNM